MSKWLFQIVPPQLICEKKPKTWAPSPKLKLPQALSMVRVALPVDAATPLDLALGPAIRRPTEQLEL
jgi:hypothetical protein